MTTFGRLQALLVRDFDIAIESLQPDATLEGLDIDSLRMIEILFCIEDEFKVTIAGDQAELRAKLKTLHDLGEFIATLPPTASKASP